MHKGARSLKLPYTGDAFTLLSCDPRTISRNLKTKRLDMNIMTLYQAADLRNTFFKHRLAFENMERLYVSSEQKNVTREQHEQTYLINDQIMFDKFSKTSLGFCIVYKRSHKAMV